MNNTTTTIEDLARMINEGFKTTPSKQGITEVTTRLDGIDSWLNRIEHLPLPEQKRDIEDLTTRLKCLEEALSV